MTEEKQYPEFNLDIPKMGDFILYRHDRGLIGNLIKARQIKAGFTEEASQYTHIEVSFGGEWAVNVKPPMTTVTDITGHHPGQFIRIVRLRKPESMTDAVYGRKMAKLAAWAASNCNTLYDIPGLLAFITSGIKQLVGCYFCSENAMWSQQKEFPDVVTIKPEDSYPATFINESIWELIWQGYLPKGIKK
jgi:hypothetical protein